MPYKPRKFSILFVIISDVICIIISFLLARYLRTNPYLFSQTKPTPLQPYLDILPFVIIINLFCYQLIGLYQRKNVLKPLWEQIPLIFIATTAATFLLMATTFLFRMYIYSRIVIFLFWILSFLSLVIWRAFKEKIETHLRKKGIGVSRLMILGITDTSKKLATQFNMHPELGFKVVGFVKDNKIETEEIQSATIVEFPILGTVKELANLFEKQIADELLVATPGLSAQKIAELSLLCEQHGIRLHLIPDFYDLMTHRATLFELFGIPIVTIEERVFVGWKKITKRTLDILIASLGLVITSPLILLISILIKLDRKAPGPVFFKQVRVGRRGKKFVMYKFRSMVAGAEEMQPQVANLNIATPPLFKIRNDPRVTRIGKWLRRYSLDELPQLFNVIKGEMSIVGPRPALPEEVAQYQDWQKKRLEVHPGITGLWQISGRSDLSFNDMVKLDLYYIENWSLMLDLRIIFKTFQAVFQAKGAY